MLMAWPGDSVTDSLTVAARQTRVLYRQFLFRIVDLELLSATAQGDADTLLGQFASLLVFISLIFGFTGLTLLGSPLPPVLRDEIGRAHV